LQTYDKREHAKYNAGQEHNKRLETKGTEFKLIMIGQEKRRNTKRKEKQPQIVKFCGKSIQTLWTLSFKV
jgi:hypothetical protein